MVMEETSHHLEFTEITCPFCHHQQTIKVLEEIENEDAGRSEGTGIDYWNCQRCGESYELNLDAFEEQFQPLRTLIEQGDWLSLLQCYDQETSWLLILLAKQYLQQCDFFTSLQITKTLLQADPEDWEAQLLQERIERRDKKMPIQGTFSDLEAAFAANSDFLHHAIDLQTGKILAYSDDSPLPEEVKRRWEIDGKSFLKIPAPDSQENHRLRESFAHEIGEHQGMVTIGEKLAIALQQPKPFGKFKEILQQFPAVREQWFTFERNVLREHLVDWIAEHNLICQAEGG